MDERGAAPTLAVFTLFVLLCSAAAFVSFQAGHQRQVSTIQQLIAVDVARTAAFTIESELNQTLRSAIATAMYEAGGRAENRENVEQRVRAYLNERIALGWSYSNIAVSVPPCDENSLVLEWPANGSIIARGHLAAEVRHVGGAVVSGMSLSVEATPRFERIHHVAELVREAARGAENLTWLELKLNENYACEGLEIEIWADAGGVTVVVRDTFAAKVVIRG